MHSELSEHPSSVPEFCSQALFLEDSNAFP